MAATELTVQTMTSAGLEATFTAANADGNFFENNGRTFIWIKNGDVSDHSIVIDSPGACDQGFYHDVTVVVAAGEERLIGPFTTARFNDTNGNVNVTYSAVTSVTIAVVKFG